jgi:hypothetical protein
MDTKSTYKVNSKTIKLWVIYLPKYYYSSFFEEQ